jgi:hypothetical protein
MYINNTLSSKLVFVTAYVLKLSIELKKAHDSEMHMGMGEMRNAYNTLVRTLDGKRYQERPRRRWMDNIRMSFREIGWKNVD